MTRYFENHEPKRRRYRSPIRKPTREQLEALVRLREKALEDARRQLREYDAS